VDGSATSTSRYDRSEGAQVTPGDHTIAERHRLREPANSVTRRRTIANLTRAGAGYGATRRRRRGHQEVAGWPPSAGPRHERANGATGNARLAPPGRRAQPVPGPDAPPGAGPRGPGALVLFASSASARAKVLCATMLTAGTRHAVGQAAADRRDRGARSPPPGSTNRLEPQARREKPSVGATSSPDPPTKEQATTRSPPDSLRHPKPRRAAIASRPAPDSRATALTKSRRASWALPLPML